MTALDDRRQLAAQAAFERHDFGENLEPEDAGGWEWTTPGDVWTRPLYFPNAENADGPTIGGAFQVEFHPQSAVAKGAFASISGNDVGHQPAPPDEWEDTGAFWYRKLGAATFDQVLSDELDIIKITRERGGFWLNRGDYRGEDLFSTLDAAKVAGNILADISIDHESDRIVKSMGLDAELWRLVNDQNPRFELIANPDTTVAPTGDGRWTASLANEESGSAATATEAAELLGLDSPPALKLG